MNIHDAIVNELFESKSIGAFVYVIERGRELEFTYNDNKCFVSMHGTQKKFSLWLDEDEQSFENMEDLLTETRIDNKNLFELWEQIELGTLY